MDIFYGKHKNGKRKAYYVFPDTNRREEILRYINEVRRHTKMGCKYKHISVWIRGEELYLERVEGSRKQIAIVREV